MNTQTLALLAALTVAAGCARPYAPPGGERDVAEPRLVMTEPEPLAVVAPGNWPVVFRFDERISERGFSEALFNVSPLDSALRIDRSGSAIEVRLDGGWRPNRVYRVVVLPGVRDLFGNQRNDPVELVFSTGAPVGNTALAGIVNDRLSGTPSRRGVVDAVHTTDSARYTAMADSAGFYSLRYLPVGEYDVRAYDDQNGNRRRDALEPVDSGHTAVLAQPTDTVALIFNVLSADTTAPRVMSAAAADSLHVLVELDDFIDPGDVARVTAEVHLLPDSTRYAGGVRMVPAPVYAAEQRAADEQRAAAAQAAADSAALGADTVGAVPDSVRRPPRARPVPAVQQPAAQDPSTLPVREIVVQLERQLVPGTYTITLAGVVNLHGLTGGGTARFDVRAPDTPPPQPPPPDSSGIGTR